MSCFRDFFEGTARNCKDLSTLVDQDLSPMNRTDLGRSPVARHTNHEWPGASPAPRLQVAIIFPLQLIDPHADQKPRTCFVRLAIASSGYYTPASETAMKPPVDGEHIRWPIWSLG